MSITSNFSGEIDQDRKIYTNSTAKSWTSSSSDRWDIATSGSPAQFHSQLPNYFPTDLVDLPRVASELGLRRVLLKNESSRLGLPSFKILGASWGIFRALASKYDIPLDASYKRVAEVAQRENVRLCAATDGNHGRAVARMAQLLGVEAKIYVPGWLDMPTRDFVASEGAEVLAVDGDYDVAVRTAWESTQKDPQSLLIQDTAWDGYEEIPKWIVDGYSTLLQEIDDQTATSPPTHLVCPVGVGSFAQAVVSHAKSTTRSLPRPAVLTVEPAAAACVTTSLINGCPVTITTGFTIMSGMNCGTVSSIAWPVLRNGVDASVSVSDVETDKAINWLREVAEVDVGPCGAATLAGLRAAAASEEIKHCLGLNEESVVVLLCTEGTRAYDLAAAP